MRIIIVLIFLVMTFSVADAVNDSVKVTQAASGWFKKNDDTIVLAVEEFEKPLRLLVLKRDRTLIYSKAFSDDYPPQKESTPVNPFLRFKMLDIKGLPSPIVLAVAAQPGGSDINYELNLVAEKQGNITSINPLPIHLSIQDGVYLGHINKKYGYGMIVWKFEFDAAHYAPHKYKISIYQWDRKTESFTLKKAFVTKKRFESGEDALKSYGLPSENFRNVVMLPEQEMSTLGLEEEYFPFIESDNKQGHNQADAPDQKPVR